MKDQSFKAPIAAGSAAIDAIFELFEQRGNSIYPGEEVTQTEHSLQTAEAAEQAGAPPALVAAGLLHDIGHFLHGFTQDAAVQGINTRHEDIGAAWLARCFGPELTEPIKLHVAAKRYLCAVDPDYFEGLSEASRRSLELQGGPMTASGIATFKANPYCADAVALRRYDDAGKERGRPVKDLEQYRPLLESLLVETATAA